MNNLLQLKGTLLQKKNASTPGAPRLSSGKKVTRQHLESLKYDLETLYKKWSKNDIIKGALVSVYYERIVPKSKRIKILLSEDSKESNISIVGAKFTSENEPKHIITHFVSLECIEKNIDRISKSIIVLNKFYNGIIDNEGLKQIDKYKKQIEKIGLSKSLFGNVIVDSSSVEKFDILDNSELLKEENIVTLYDTKSTIEEIMKRLGISHNDYSKLDDNTVLLRPENIAKIKSEAPYLIAMTTTNIADYKFKDLIKSKETKNITIPKPTNEPTIGVIDTLFDKNVYFNEWVDSKNLLPKEIETNYKDYIHGTAVTSIIVDGPTFNPDLDDGCGRFKVRHFGVARQGINSSFTIIKDIQKIVNSNKDIKVWNLSLGSALEVNPNFISPEAALLDEIQFKNNVIFVVAGTNKFQKDVIKIGSPADSINSLVVNSVKLNGEKASYSRKGKVLSFFNKPDICYYGGDENEEIRTCIGTGEYMVSGTSFAAPWISRKLAYLIETLQLTREIAKALLIDSATEWNNIDSEECEYLGFGKVPIRIEDVINAPKDEIKFYIEDVSTQYDTYTHNIPVPIYQDKYPFIAKATLCYFPKCTRNQGVDYTNTELDIYFGRINGQGRINSINENRQSEGELGITKEKEARNSYRKWDNVKHITQVLKKNVQPKQKYDNKLWGLSVKTKERLGTRDVEGIKFGVVVRLKEINGVNRIDEFIKQCFLRGWLVNKIDVENRIDIYNTAQEEVEFE